MEGVQLVDSRDGGTTRACVGAGAQAPPRTEIGDTPEVVGEVRWRKTMKMAVNENSELVLDPLLYLTISTTTPPVLFGTVIVARIWK